MAEDWDFELQRDQTAHSVAELSRETGITEGTEITLELQFLPSAQANPESFARALKMFGYAEPFEEDDGITVSVPAVAFSLDSIWLHEERVSKIAFNHGYVPEGWGFWEPEEE